MDTTRFKDALEAELLQIEGELRSKGRLISPESGNWEAMAPDMDTMPPQADPNEAADKIEEFETNRDIEENLEARWKEIKHALEKLERGTYGFCEVDNEPLDEARLDANPAARTCVAHA